MRLLLGKGRLLADLLWGQPSLLSALDWAASEAFSKDLFWDLNQDLWDGLNRGGSRLYFLELIRSLCELIPR